MAFRCRYLLKSLWKFFLGNQKSHNTLTERKASSFLIRFHVDSLRTSAINPRNAFISEAFQTWKKQGILSFLSSEVAGITSRLHSSCQLRIRGRSGNDFSSILPIAVAFMKEFHEGRNSWVKRRTLKLCAFHSSVGSHISSALAHTRTRTFHSLSLPLEFKDKKFYLRTFSWSSNHKVVVLKYAYMYLKNFESVSFQ